MRVLLVEGAPGSGVEAEAELRAAGHEVVGCEPSDPSAPCRGLETFANCPLDRDDIDVAVILRTGPAETVFERGGLCAARRRVPVVVAGESPHAVSFGPGTHLAGGDVVGAAEKAARSGAAHEAAIRRELLMAAVVMPDDVDGVPPLVSFEVIREVRRLRLVVRAPAGEPRLDSITKSAVEALRRFDRWVAVIDVVSEPS